MKDGQLVASVEDPPALALHNVRRVERFWDVIGCQPTGYVAERLMAPHQYDLCLYSQDPSSERAGGTGDMRVFILVLPSLSSSFPPPCRDWNIQFTSIALITCL